MELDEFFPRDPEQSEEFYRELERKLDEKYASLMPADRKVFLTEIAVVTGANLLQLKALSVYGALDWHQTLAKLQIAAGTARNYMALARFARKAPSLFERLKMLDRQELYRLARLGPEKAKEIYPEAAVEDAPLEG